MKTIRFLAIIFLTMTMTSCCTILNSSYQTIMFKSNVPDAKVMVNTREIGKTNEYIKVKRSDLDGLFRISEDGCITKEMELPLVFPVAYLGTAIFGIVPFFGATIASIDLSPQNHLKTQDVIQSDLDCPGKIK